MRKNRNGFTLIELLAVIVLLAIISLIAVPIVLNIVNDAKQSSALRSLELYKKAVENAYLKHKMLNPYVDLTAAELKQIVEYDGEKIDCNIYLDDNEKINIYNCYVNGKLFEHVDYTYKNQTQLNVQINGENVNIGDEVVYKNGNSFYKDSEGNNVKWYVIGEEDGHLLILSDPVKLLDDNGNEIIFNGLESYKNGIGILDSKAQQFLNTKYATSARSVRAIDINKLTGYNPNYVPKSDNSGNIEVFGESNDGDKIIERYSNNVNYTNNNGVITSTTDYGDGGTTNIFYKSDGNTLKNGESIDVVNDYYSYHLKTLFNSSDWSTNFYGDINGLDPDSNIFNIIHFVDNNNNSYKYWVADKSVLGKSNRATYSLRIVWGNAFSKQTLYRSTGENEAATSDGPNPYLRVVVKLKTEDALKKESISITKSNNSYIFDSKDSNGVSTTKVCIRATNLNTDICSTTKSANYCRKWGYELNEQITYGKVQSGTTLSVGDAFDCDINADGLYDSTNERFYYLTTLENDSSTALLIYNKNYKENVPYYSEANDNSFGPVTAIASLPTIQDWKNVRLTNVNRDLGNYTGKAARLLTIAELRNACGISGNDLIGVCSFLFENTRFDDGNTGLYGYWLENTYSTHSACNVYAGNVNINNAQTTSGSGNYGVRPVIEIPKYELDY